MVSNPIQGINVLVFFFVCVGAGFAIVRSPIHEVLPYVCKYSSSTPAFFCSFLWIQGSDLVRYSLGPVKWLSEFEERWRGTFLVHSASVYSVAVHVGVHTCIWQMCSCAQIPDDYILYDRVFLFLLERQAWPNTPPDSVPALRFMPSVGGV
jgi:hypothetical protein